MLHYSHVSPQRSSHTDVRLLYINQFMNQRKQSTVTHTSHVTHEPHTGKVDSPGQFSTSWPTSKPSCRSACCSGVQMRARHLFAKNKSLQCRAVWRVHRFCSSVVISCPSLSRPLLTTLSRPPSTNASLAHTCAHILSGVAASPPAPCCAQNASKAPLRALFPSAPSGR
jgi:hypothetical protein